MPVSRKTVDRLYDLLRRDGKVTYRAWIDAREARYLTRMLDRITTDDEDGDALRFFLIRSMRGERPPIDIYRGHTSTCRIDGPWQEVDHYWLPLGGLVLTIGATAHLDPFEAKALHRKMEEVVEAAIRAWARDQDLYSLPEGTESIDSDLAERAAKVMIAAWAEQQRASTNGRDVEPIRPRARDLIDTLSPPCRLCGRRLAHA
ncbi:hypothetical protein [Novosphingobium sp. KACC 22771]|uniref:hypothetical protein n=1 Tax=Novosphingobium sp. KACC 22771 TaxID=3025670 RepID=UPI0023670289|nr:hypothetical protein [Novosphingobium sp. KACC 22771]WDF73608.1 hypothetical protein PQ467_06095 [Novosphingobium sp. KACC 22771]